MTLTLNPRRAMVMAHTHAKMSRSKVSWFKIYKRADTTDLITLSANAVGKNKLTDHKETLTSNLM